MKSINNNDDDDDEYDGNVNNINNHNDSNNNKNNEHFVAGKTKEEKLKKAVGRVLIALSFKKKPSKKSNKNVSNKSSNNGKDTYPINGEFNLSEEGKIDKNVEKDKVNNHKRRREHLICVDSTEAYPIREPGALIGEEAENEGRYDASFSTSHQNYISPPSPTFQPSSHHPQKSNVYHSESKRWTTGHKKHGFLIPASLPSLSLTAPSSPLQSASISTALSPHTIIPAITLKTVCHL